MAYETILVETRGKVGLITLNRPQALNALNSGVERDVVAALQALDADDGVGAIVITGSEKAFAAGADIKEMSDKSYIEMYSADFFAGWDAMLRIRKPIIAAVSGYALGGGCELAMMCDFIIAGDNAKFGQPEITLGVMPGMGGSQRLTRFVGRSPASRSRRWRWSRRRSTAPTRRRLPKGCASSAACSIPCSRWRTRRRAWPPSPRSASPLSAIAETAARTGQRVGARR
jgi:enoyl-CoA hydratase/carnithine racemase